MDRKEWIFLSPHFDDVVLSCGGLVWDLANQGHTVRVWTIMAGFPSDENFSPFAQQNHQAWGKAGAEAIAMRREEDINACQVLGARSRHFDWMDAIYRHHPETGLPLVNNNEELFSAPPESALIEDVAKMLAQEIPTDAILVSPMGLGGHLDHRVVVQAGQKTGRVNFYFADYPYILWDFDSSHLTDSLYQIIPRPLSKEALYHWQNAILCYSSQLSAFWQDEDETRLAILNYLAGGGGRLWEKLKQKT
jgi:LmbE family N-acetylglucosaminyl deacetylase